MLSQMGDSDSSNEQYDAFHRDEDRRRVVIIGGGFAGLATARGLKNADVHVTLIDRNNYHLFQPLLYQVASAALAPANIAEPIRRILKNQTNTDVILGEAAAIDTNNRHVRLKDDDRSVPYDLLVVATGSRHTYFGNDDWEEHAPGLKTLDDALRIREKILLAFERAEQLPEDREAERTAQLTFVVIGGGPTGVEMAGAIAEIASRTIRRDFRNIDPASARVILAEGMDRILPPYPEELSQKARRQLEHLGVEVRTGALAEEVNAGGVRVGKDWIESRTVLWAAGNACRSVVDSLGAERGSGGRIVVGPDLALRDHPEIFVIGDTAAAVHPGASDPGAPELLPALAPVAIQQGQYVARLIKKRYNPHERPPFRYRDRGSMATIGRARAVAQIYGRNFSGWFAWLLWSVVHVFFLIGFRNRLSVMLEWIWHYCTFQRSSRLITWRDRGEDRNE